MSKLYKNIIAIDLETTGVEPTRDEILEIGAALLCEGKVTDRFGELLTTEKPPPPQVIKLTGITPDMQQGARSFEMVLPDFLKFLDREDTLYIAHNASFDRSFLRLKSADMFKHKMLDTVGLSRICFPTLESHSLSFLTEHLQLPPQAEHRAVGDALTTLELWQHLEERALDFPRELVEEINFLISPLKNHPYRDFFLRLEKASFTRNFGKESSPLVKLFKSHKELIETKKPERDFDEEHGKLDTATVEGHFSPTGELAASLPGFESREGQVRMAGLVAEAFSDDMHLMVEAPTGIGKSLAYLIPAIKFAIQEDRPVVLSTNTKNLQSQLFEKDIPLVEKALGVKFKSALIKGRGNYICLRKLFYVLDSAARELDRDERMQMVTLLSWAINTTTGDISECVLTGRPNFPPLWAKLRTLGDECLGRSCKTFNRCFLRRARAKSLQADVVVANHALIFSELNMESSVLPEYRNLVFDEAHNLETAATEHLSVEINQARMHQVFNRLWRGNKRRGKGGTGLASSILHALGSDACKAPKELAELAAKNGDTLVKNIESAHTMVTPFLDAIAAALPASKGDDRRRFAQGTKRPSVWEGIEKAKIELVAAIAGAMRSAEALVQNMKDMPPGSMPYLRDFQRELEAVVQWLREIIADTEFVMAGSEANYVYWIERLHKSRGGVQLVAAPLSIAEIMHDQLYARKASCIFSSATLTVRDKFDFLAGRLGIDRIDHERLLTLEAPTPFNYDEQCFIAVPTFLPEPGGGDGGADYTTELSLLLQQVFRITQGRGLALFTSYRMLRDCWQNMQEGMLGDGITVMAQGESGSRESITARFVRDVHSVLLGTHSFWEGVDVVGEALSCLAIARLPFAVFTDPIVEARCEQVEAEGKSAFMHYSIPNAVIRFKQGFGRLVRSRNDRGMVIIADRRVVSKRYGKVFLDSLPTGAEVFNNREDFLDAVEEFFS